MLKSEYALYLGAETQEILVDFIVEDDLFIVIEVEGEIDKRALKETLVQLKSELHNLVEKTLSSFESTLSRVLLTVGSELAISYAAGQVAGPVLYLVTRGKGLVMMQRNKKFTTLINSNNSASGYIQDSDVIIFTTKAFVDLAGMSMLSITIEGKEPKGIVDELTPRLKEHDDQGAIAIFVRFAKEEITEENGAVPDKIAASERELTASTGNVSYESQGQVLETNLGALSLFLHRARTIINTYSRRKQLTTVVAIVLFIILLWSVVFGLQRRHHSQLVQHVKQVSAIIDTKLIEAKDLFALNPDKALALLAEAKTDYQSLKEATRNEKINEVAQIEKKIAVAEKSIRREKDVRAEEFFDLNLIEKGTHGEALYREGDIVAILNSDRGEIYTLSLSKKSTEIISDTTIKGASMVALLGKDVLFFSKKRGIFKAAEEKPKRVVPADKDIKNPVSLWTYNNNLYLLDSTGLYKYLVTEDGYSNKMPYFKGKNQPSMSSTIDMAIDSSVYILTSSGLRRYTAGLLDGFALRTPDKDISFEMLYTDSESDNIYLLDTDSGRLFIFSKTGEFKKQYSSSIIKNATDFFVSEQEGGAFVLVSDMLYKIAF